MTVHAQTLNFHNTRIIVIFNHLAYSLKLRILLLHLAVLRVSRLLIWAWSFTRLDLLLRHCRRGTLYFSRIKKCRTRIYDRTKLGIEWAVASLTLSENVLVLSSRQKKILATARTFAVIRRGVPVFLKIPTPR